MHHLLKTARKTLVTIIAIGVKIIAIREERLNSIPLKQKAGGFFLLLGWTNGKELKGLRGVVLSSVFRPSGFANWQLWKLGSYSPVETEGIGMLSPSIITIQRDGFQVLEKDISACCRRFASQRGRERIYNCKFSRVNALKQGSLDTCS